MTYPPYASAKQGLGRYVLEHPLSGSTTLNELSVIVERDFGIAKNLHAAFTIFPQDLTHPQPAWHDKPLPLSTTVAEASSYDEDAAGDEDAAVSTPVDAELQEVHLVLETKAAALRRIVGTDFLSVDLGDTYRTYRDAWNRFQGFNHNYHMNEYQACHLRTLLAIWRHAKYALLYLRKQKQKQDLSQVTMEATSIRAVDEQIEKLHQDKEEARASILAMIRWWASWVRERDELGAESKFE